MSKGESIVGLKECKKKFEKIKKEYFLKELQRVCDALLFDAYEEREFLGFTGNTQTSYTCGLYIEGKLEYIISLGHSLSKPVRMKVRKGELAFLENPYEGEARSVYGSVDVDDKYGFETAINFLKGRKTPKDSFSIVMTTGTEYSEYIEKCRNLNVLTETYQSVKTLLSYNILPIK